MSVRPTRTSPWPQHWHVAGQKEVLAKPRAVASRDIDFKQGELKANFCKMGLNIDIPELKTSEEKSLNI